MGKAIRGVAIALLIGAMTLGLAACASPDDSVSVGYPGYRTLPPGQQVSRASSGTSNGQGCVPPPGRSATC